MRRVIDQPPPKHQRKAYSADWKQRERQFNAEFGTPCKRVAAGGSPSDQFGVDVNGGWVTLYTENPMRDFVTGLFGLITIEAHHFDVHYTNTIAKGIRVIWVRQLAYGDTGSSASHY